MKETYFLIYNSDGDTRITEVNKEEFLRDVEEGNYGENATFITEAPEIKDTNYWGENTYLLIKGIVVAPVAKKVVTKYDME